MYRKAIETLKGRGPEDLIAVVVEIASTMLYLAQIGTKEECMKKVKRVIADGSALEKLKLMVERQGGDGSYIENPDQFEKAIYQHEIIANNSGYIGKMNTEECGKAAVLLGAGREVKDDPIDMTAGIQFNKKTGDAVKQGDIVAIAYSSSKEKLQQGVQKTAQDVNSLKEEVDGFHKLSAGVEDLEALQEMAAEENDESLLPEMDELLEKCRSELEHLELGMLLSGEYDANNAILTLHAGAGGTEAQDWTSMLLRMFTRFAEQNGFALEMLDYQPGDEAGVKSATIQVNGHNAYGFLRSEKGVHRLVRISPFDANARRHTSFAAVDVMPELDDTVDVNINMDEVRVDVYRSSGAGGQHVNKTSSAVRMTHEPTGIVVQCQNERSQIQNRERCLQMLRAKLYEYEKAKQDALVSDIAGDYQNIEWGSQIRSYVFQPYTMVKDHRTGCETGNIQAVMDGDLMPFVEAYLRSQQKKV